MKFHFNSNLYSSSPRSYEVFARKCERKCEIVHSTRGLTSRKSIAPKLDGKFSGSSSESRKSSLSFLCRTFFFVFFTWKDQIRFYELHVCNYTNNCTFCYCQMHYYSVILLFMMSSPKCLIVISHIWLILLK